MVQDKLISVRTNSYVVDRIDAFALEHSAWTRTQIIHILLAKLFQFASGDDLYKLLSVNNVTKVTINVEYSDLRPEL